MTDDSRWGIPMLMIEVAMLLILPWLAFLRIFPKG